MNISIDTVYQRVLALANKEQRGYITPQEFNLFANHAQMDIFEQYFYDMSQLDRLPGNDREFSDLIDQLQEKIGKFQIENWSGVDVLNQYGDINILDVTPDLYRLGAVNFGHDDPATGKRINSICERMERRKEQALYGNNPLTRWSKKYPVYARLGFAGYRIKIYPYPNNYNNATSPGTDAITYTYIRKPKDANWGYTVVNEQAQYNASVSTDFELHPSEVNNLVIKILALAGIMIKNPTLYQVASQEEIKDIQQEKA